MEGDFSMIDKFRGAFLLGASALATAASLKVAVPGPARADEIDLNAKLIYPFSVHALPYAYDTNEPAIDALTMQLHHEMLRLRTASNSTIGHCTNCLPISPICPSQSAPQCATTRGGTLTTACSGN
jgi:Iron/manganese superoxide dismutases, alpha-hairpin domain